MFTCTWGIANIGLMRNMSWVIPIIAATITLISVAVGAYLNSYLSHGRFFREKEWETKRQIYSEIIAHIVSAERLCEWISDGFSGGDYLEFWNSERLAKLKIDMWKNYAKAQRSFAGNFLFASADFRSIFTDFENQIKKERDDESVPDVEWDKYLLAFRSTRICLTDIALAELCK
ncbi:MAG TPA: hypothetical protein VHY35_09560 [Stellaceae bacterium]|jgi:hypothetical protein|nr:hypothetical protein [Stellaceae bacterium]